MKGYLLIGFMCGLVLAGTTNAAETPTANTTTDTEASGSPSNVQSDITESSAKPAQSTWALGVGLGAGNSTYVTDQVGSNVIPGGIVKKGETSGAAKFFLLHNLSTYWELQITLVNLGEYTLEEEGFYSGSYYDVKASVDASGLYFTPVLKLPFAENRGAAYLKLGLGVAAISETVSGQDSFAGSPYYIEYATDSSAGISASAGLGVRYDLNAKWGLMAEDEGYSIPIKEKGTNNTSTMQINLASIGVYYRL